MCDGSVRAIDVSIDVQNYRRLGVGDDGEVITVDFWLSMRLVDRYRVIADRFVHRYAQT